MFFYDSMDSFHYKTYVHILFSEENYLICSYLEEVYFILIASFQQFPDIFSVCKMTSVWPISGDWNKHVHVHKINYYLIVHVKYVHNIHAFLFIVDKQVTIVKLRLQNMNFNYLPYFHNNTDRLKNKFDYYTKFMRKKW